jgi:hypothetical protein
MPAGAGLSRGGGGGGTAPDRGGGGGTGLVTERFPSKGGGTANRAEGGGVSSTGSFDGRGGGGGPGLLWLTARWRPGNTGVLLTFAPASARGGGTLNVLRAGDDPLGGLGDGEGGLCIASAPPAFLLAGGGAGGGPLVPECCGLTRAASGGGGGGALNALSRLSASAAAVALFCSR